MFLSRFLRLLLSQMTEEKWSFFHSSRAHVHRSSCAATEVARINALLQKKIGQSILGKVKQAEQAGPLSTGSLLSLTPSRRHDDELLWNYGCQYGTKTTEEKPQTVLHLPPSAQVHLAMVRYHEGGRFCGKDEQWDQESAMFHLETAAMCGELEAIVAIGQCYLQLPHHVLPEVEVEVCCTLP